MIKLIIAMLMFIPVSVLANTYSISAGYSKIEHAWRGPDNRATYRPTLKTVGFHYLYSKKVELGITYGEPTDATTKGRYSHLELRMDYLITLEAKYIITRGDFKLFGGINYNIMDTPVYKADGWTDNDMDNDYGFFIGADYALNNNWSIRTQLISHSRIKVPPYDEWTRSLGVGLVYKF